MLHAVTVAEGDSGQWSQFLRDFPGAYEGFRNNLAALKKLEPQIAARPELQAEYLTLVNRAGDLAPKLDQLKSTYDAVAGFFGKVGDVRQSAIDWTSQAIEDVANKIAAAKKWLGLGELGIAPIVVAIGVGAAITTLGALVYWITDAYKFQKRVGLALELEERGMDPSQINSVLNQAVGRPSGGGIGDTVSNILWVVALVGLAVVVAPKVKSLLESRRG